jgi:hypothetical protein
MAFVCDSHSRCSSYQSICELPVKNRAAKCTRKTKCCFRLEITDFDLFYLSVLEQHTEEDRKLKYSNFTHNLKPYVEYIWNALRYYYCFYYYYYYHYYYCFNKLFRL